MHSSRKLKVPTVFKLHSLHISITFFTNRVYQKTCGSGAAKKKKLQAVDTKYKL
jgi:hypothetical protein